MSKTTATTQLSQTGHILPHEIDDEPAVTQSPPLINDQNDQKVRIDGHSMKLDHEGVGDHMVENKNNNICIIDVKNGEEKEKESEIECNEKVCRICHLGCDHLPAGTGNVNLVQLGCSCKGELGVSHYHCAQAWFMHKGNRICEICGKPAKNIQGIEDINYQELEAEVISSINIAMGSSSEERSNRCVKSFCNFILAVLILAFILPWVLHPGKLL